MVLVGYYNCMTNETVWVCMVIALYHRTLPLNNVVAIIFILVSKGYKKFVHRLTLYLIVAVQFHGVVSILQVVPVYHNGTVVATRRNLRDFALLLGF